MAKQILVADDDVNLLKLYARIFAGKEWSLSMSSSVEEASKLIKANHYDLLVTDLVFPDGLGTELIKRFEEKHAGAKSILVTGTPDSGGRRKRDGIAELILKPFKTEHLLTAVRGALNK